MGVIIKCANRRDLRAYFAYGKRLPDNRYMFWAAGDDGGVWPKFEEGGVRDGIADNFRF